MEKEKRPEQFVVMTDGVIDDLLALHLLCNCTSGHHVIVSTFGNIPERRAYENIRDFVSISEHASVLSQGSDVPLSGMIAHEWLTGFNGEDGVWGVRPEYDKDRREEQLPLPEITRVISLAALTDVARMMQVPNNIDEVTVMGGAFGVPGNCSSYAECNIYYDADAAYQFFSTCEGMTVRVVPRDVVMDVSWTADDFVRIPETNEYNRWMKRVLMAWQKNYAQDRQKALHLYDPVAVYLTLFPDEAEWEEHGVEVIKSGEHIGATIFNADYPRCQIAVALKDTERVNEALFRHIFLEV